MNQNHRNNDPSTSALAGRDFEASGSARRHRVMCFEIVKRLPGLTAREIEEQLGIKAHKRLPELRTAKLVCNGPVRTCSITGRQAMTWLPGPFTQSPSQYTGANS